MPRGRPRSKISLEDFPTEFRMALIKFMADKGINSLEKGLAYAGRFLQSNSEIFYQEVKRESERKYKSRHFTEMNKTFATREKRSYNDGHRHGYNKAKILFEIQFPCYICRKQITINPSTELHLVIRDFLSERKWGHKECVG